MILITGASSGIGEACARVFAREKRDLILVARRTSRLKKLSRELASAHQIKAHVITLDVSSKRQVDAAFKKHRKILSEVEVLINNAGLASGLSPIQEGDIRDWETMIDTNVKGLLYLTRAVLPSMVRRGSGQVVNLGSVAGHYCYPKGNVYSATKYAVHAITESMRLDLNGTGVRVSEVSPGMVETEFSKVRLRDDARAKAVYEGMTPLTGDDVADAIAWCVNRPKHVNIQEVVLYPTDQASPTVVHQRRSPA